MSPETSSSAESLSATSISAGGQLTAEGATDIFFAKLSPTGGFVWGKRFGDADHQRVEGLAVNAGGDLFATGWFYGTLDFGSEALVSAGGMDVFVTELAR